jgi:hypothetical protein
VACETGGRESIRRPVVEGAISAVKPNRKAAKDYRQRRGVAHEQEQHGKIKRYGFLVGEERSHREDPGRLNANACTGRRSEASVRLSRIGNRCPSTFLTEKPIPGSTRRPVHGGEPRDRILFDLYQSHKGLLTNYAAYEVLRKVNSLSPTYRVVVRMRSPDAPVEPDCACASGEKQVVTVSAAEQPVLCSPVGRGINCEMRALFVYFGTERTEFLCTSDCLPRGREFYCLRYRKSLCNLQSRDSILCLRGTSELYCHARVSRVSPIRYNSHEN